MANKQKKKRNKAYSGVDAAATRPTVTRISAVHRSAPRQWWFEHKKIAKPVNITILVITGIVILIVELVRISSGA